MNATAPKYTPVNMIAGGRVHLATGGRINRVSLCGITFGARATVVDEPATCPICLPIEIGDAADQTEAEWA